ncbi:MAG: YciI family protein [Caulobacteraceae bacterium]|nr:YciI family protein [Caulobacter sp.]
MPLFTVDCRDRDDAGDLRAQTRPAHLDWLAAHAGRVRLAGPRLDGHGRAVGTLAIVEADDLGAAVAWAAQDPYAHAGLFATTAVEAWRVAVGGFGERQG